MINVPNFMTFGIFWEYIWDQIFLNEGSDPCFNVEYVLLGYIFDFLGGC